MARNSLRKRSRQCQQHRQGRDEPPLQPSRRAHADQVSHQQPEIETACVNQQSLQNVGVSAKVPIAIGDSVVRGIDRVDPKFRLARDPCRIEFARSAPSRRTRRSRRVLLMSVSR